MISVIELKKLFDNNGEINILQLRYFGKSIIEDLKGKTLIGELEISREFFDILDDNIFLYKKYLLENDYDCLEFRAILSFYLVWIGVFKYGEYDEKKYWDNFKKAFGITNESSKKIHTNKIGEIFLRTIKELNLETFKSIEEGHKYVMRIFLHGFMPNAELKRFIKEFILQPSYNETFFNSYDLLNRYKKQAREKIPAIPKPIIRFLEYANPININLIDGFIDIRSSYNSNKSNNNSFLPNHIVECFYEVLEKSIPNKNKRQLVLTRNLPPVLKLNYDGLFIFIPSQTVNESYVSFVKVRVEFESNNERITIDSNLNTSRKNNIIFTDEKEVSVPLSSKYSIFINNNLVKEIKVDSMGETNPILIFNSKNNQLLNIVGETTSKSNEIAVLTNKKLLLENVEDNYSDTFTGDYTISYYELKQDSKIFLIKNAIKTDILDKILDYNSDNSFKLIGEPLKTWIKNLNDYPIYTNKKSLKIEAISQNKIPLRINIKNLNFNKILYVGVFNKEFEFSDLKDFESGFYEVRIFQGLITKEIINFVYLEDAFFQRANDTYITTICDKISFSIKNQKPLIEDKYIRENDFYVFKKEEQVNLKPYYRLDFFKESNNPISLLLFKRDIRWGITSKNSSINWDEWLIEKQELTVKEIKELREKRLLVELDERIVGKNDYFELILKNSQQVLITSKANKFKRNNSSVFIFDLESYANQISNLNFFEATLYFKINNKIEVELFDIFLQVKIENLSVKTISLGEKERIEIDWLNTEKTKQIEEFNFVYALKSNIEKVFSKKIKNNPPVFLDLDLVTKKSIYLAYLEVNNSKYSFKKSFNTQIPCVYWIRKNTIELENIKINNKLISFDKEEISFTWDNNEVMGRVNSFFVFYPENNLQDLKYEKIENNKVTISLPEKSGFWQGNIVFSNSDRIIDLNNLDLEVNKIQWYRKKIIIPFEGLNIIKNSIKEKHDFQEFFISWNKNSFDPKEDLIFVCCNENNESSNLLDISYEPNGVKILLPQVNNQEKWIGYIDTIDNFSDFNFSKKNIVKWDRNPEKAWSIDNKFFNNLKIETLDFIDGVYKIALSWDYKEDEPTENKFLVYFNSRIKKVFYKKLPDIIPPFEIEIDNISEFNIFWDIFIQTSINEELNPKTFNFNINGVYWNPDKKNLQKPMPSASKNIDSTLLSKSIQINFLVDKKISLKSLRDIFKYEKQLNDKNLLTLNVSTEFSDNFIDKLKNRNHFLKHQIKNNTNSVINTKKTLVLEDKSNNITFFNNFSVETIGIFQGKEKIILYWDYKKDENKNTHLNILDSKNKVYIKEKIINKPPILLSEELINFKDSYKCYISNSNTKSEVFCSWDRLGLSDMKRSFLELKESSNIKKNQDTSFFKYWNIFLALIKNSSRNSELIELLGEDNFKILTPLHKNSNLTIKIDNNDIKLNFKILFSDISFKNGSSLSKFPDKFKITIQNNNHNFKYFTSEFNKLSIENYNNNIVIENENYGSFKSWLSSLIYLGENKKISNFSVSSTIPLNSIWINPPEFLFLDELKKDSFYFTKYEYLKDHLIYRWKKFKEEFLLKDNLFISNQIFDNWFWIRFENNNFEDFLSGAVSLYFRLKTYNILKLKKDEKIEKEFHELIYLSYYFTVTYSKDLLIRDLILSELFIEWYFHKSLYNYGATSYV